jgi:hypothetical protein
MKNQPGKTFYYNLPPLDLDAKDESDEEDNKKESNAKGSITDDAASEIFDKLTKLQGKKTYYAKKNWTDDESNLLQWAI